MPVWAWITTNPQHRQVFHLCWNCPEFKEIDSPVRWDCIDGERHTRRYLCRRCCYRIRTGKCVPILGTLHPRRRNKRRRKY